MKAVLLAAMMCCSGCSMFMRNAPDKLPESPSEHLHCTTSLGAPVVDAVLAGMMGYTAVYIATDDLRNTTPSGSNGTANVAVPIVLGGATVAYLISSAIGYGKSARCVEMKDIQKERRSKP